jgi:hypothetical protein
VKREAKKMFVSPLCCKLFFCLCPLEEESPFWENFTLRSFEEMRGKAIRWSEEKMLGIMSKMREVREKHEKSDRKNKKKQWVHTIHWVHWVL